MSDDAPNRKKRKSASRPGKGAVGQDIDQTLASWPYAPGDVVARLVRAADGREVLQMRLDMGVLQMEVDGRPDGSRPGGCDSFYDHLAEFAFQDGDEMVLSEEQCMEVDREFVQYYHRRICWLALRNFRAAVRDADHTLALMDLARGHAPEEEWMLSHERYRPFVLFHRTQALALADLEDAGAEAALSVIEDGLGKMRDVFVQYEAEDHYEDDELVNKLVELRESLRSYYEVGRTLREQLSEAIDAEEYERAAKLRDQIARGRTGKH